MRTEPAQGGLAFAVGSCGGLGRLGPGPGTIGSAAALLAAWPLFAWGGSVGLLAGAALASVLGAWAVARLRKAGSALDPGFVVIDEVAGQWLAVGIAALLAPLAPWQWAAAFALFRLFDIAKPGPVGWLDRRPEAWAVIADDLAAGLLAGIGTASLGAIAAGLLP